jgi:hypothetical protein
VGSDSNVFGSLNEHGCIHEDLGNSGKAFSESVVEKEVDEVIAGGILFLFVHGWYAFRFAPPASRLGRTLLP